MYTGDRSTRVHNSRRDFIGAPPTDQRYYVYRLCQLLAQRQPQKKAYCKTGAKTSMAFLCIQVHVTFSGVKVQ